MRRRALAPAALALLAGCTELAAAPAARGRGPAPPVPAIDLPPAAPREFRGAWVATVTNIDWPSRPGLPAAAQRTEAVAIADRALALGLNALILQVRPAGDAIYPSALEPWSEYLGGEQGRGPLPAYDPLAFWIEQAHRRGLELHAWFNPYRARLAGARTPLVAPHAAVRMPAIVKRYGDLLWLDPGEPAAAVHTLAVVADVLRRYDVDGVHLDDYFYPYPVPNPELPGTDLPFPDDDSWARYQLAGGELARDDWRRSNVDALVQAVQRTVRETRPWVRFSISPFGVGRPDRRPPGVTGFSQFDRLYADPERWLENGWVDAMAPQLYWPIAREGQPFATLLDGWLAANTAGRHLWPGLLSSQVHAAVNPWPATELLDQVAVQRSRPMAGGHIHFSMAALRQDHDALAELLRAAYARPALVPATPWLPAPAVGTPVLAAQGARVRIEPGAGAAVARWAVWRRGGGDWRFDVLPAQERFVDAGTAEAVAVAAVDRVGRVGEPSIVRLN